MAPIGQSGPIEIARRIAKKMERSTETVRVTLKAYDLEHPDRAIFPPSTNPWTRPPRREIYRLYNHGRGVSAENLAVQFDRTRSSIYRVLNEMRALRLREEVKLEFMPHPSFDDPGSPRGDPRPDARADRRQAPSPDQGPQGTCRPTWPASTRSRSSRGSRKGTSSAR